MRRLHRVRGRQTTGRGMARLFYGVPLNPSTTGNQEAARGCVFFGNATNFLRGRLVLNVTFVTCLRRMDSYRLLISVPSTPRFRCELWHCRA